MEEFCGSKFWDSELTWNTTNPYFTPCFESTVLSLSPFAFLVIFGISDLANIHYSNVKSKNFRSSLTTLGVLKALLTLILMVLQMVQIIRMETQLEDNGGLKSLPVDLLSPSLQLVAYGVILVLTLVTTYYTINSSGVQFFFWLITLITQGVLARNAFENIDNLQNVGEKDEIIYLTRIISFPIICVRFLLEFFNNAGCQTNRSPLRLGKPSPEKSSTFISKLLYFWYDELAWTGYRRTLTKDDLWDLNTEETSSFQMQKFSYYWNKELEKAKRQSSKLGKKVEAGVIVPLIKSYGPTLANALFLKMVSDLLLFVQPIMLSYIVAHVNPPETEPRWKGFLYAASICIVIIVQVALNSSSGKKITVVSIRARAALSNAVFRKALLVSSASKKESSMGEMVNLQSVDCQKHIEFLPMLSVGFGGPLLILISVVLLYNNLGPSIFAGVGILFSLVPLNLYIVAVSRKYQVEQMKLKDQRLKLTSQVISGMKVLKLYAWEPAYQAQIEGFRKKEIVCLRKILLLMAVSGFIFHCAPMLVTLASFTSYVLSSKDNILNAEKTFVSISLFNIMRLPMIMLPFGFASGMQTSVSMSRLKKYLNMEELNKTAVTHEEVYEEPILVKNATLSWTPKNVVLKKINFSVKPGELVAIVGTIGSGKSSLLASLLGDLVKEEGIINTKGDIAYVSQSAWIQNATVRNNILFGDKYNETKYKRTINACALEMDLNMLSEGDETEIGEKGINLSGGQKQRVALARAAYKEASVYLFDDPLSAVDSHVGKHIFENLIGGNGILQKKTRVLVTHAISFLPQVDRIFVMKNGEITESGTYRELLKKRGEFAEFLLTHVGTEDQDEIDAGQRSVVQDLAEIVGVETVRRRSTSNRESLLRNIPGKQSINEKSEKKKETGAPAKKLITEELAAQGNIKLSIFVNYFKAAGLWFSLLSLSLHFGGNGLMGWSQIWLSEWSNQATEDEEETGTTVQATTDKYLLGYGLFAAGVSTAIFLANVTLILVSLGATKTLFSNALSRVIRSPMSYFDTTLLGTIINRFARDVDILDNLLPANLRMFLTMFFSVLFAIVLISYTTPIFIPFVIPVIILYILLQRFYVATSRQLKRMEGVSRSPIFSHFSETITGSSIIRAFGLEEDFIAESERRVDENQKSLFLFLYSTVWVNVRLEFLGVLIILSTCIVILMSRGTISPGETGLAITYALQITSLLTWLARQTSDFEAYIVSAERIGELTETPQEPAWEEPNAKLPSSWPEHGQLVFENYMTRYREGLDLVLKGISCTIKSGEKIGVVGRTGAGKSSLTLALFRLIESAGGRITIDGIDISSLGLHSLRKKLTIIPQDPVLFSGTLRLNLDPFNHYSDDQIWRCLELSHLKNFVITLKDGLQHPVSEDGQNFSVGQRQLICLARALLRKTTILILDEATAAVDIETDDLIQATIRKEFDDATVITIAHRLNTIIDSNRVMVLDKGEIKEFDSPQTLLEDSTTIFWGMAKDAKLV